MLIERSARSTAAPASALARDLENVVADSQELLRALGNDGDAKLTEVKGRVQASLNLARKRLVEVQTTVTEGAKAAAKNTDEYVHENPWPAIGASAAVGVLVGFLLGRR